MRALYQAATDLTEPQGLQPEEQSIDESLCGVWTNECLLSVCVHTQMKAIISEYSAAATVQLSDTCQTGKGDSSAHTEPALQLIFVEHLLWCQALGISKNGPRLPS